MTTTDTEADRIRRILVLLDGSPYAECTIPHAVKLADSLRAAVLLLIVNEPGGALSENELDRGARAETAHEYLSRKVQLLQELGISVETLVLEGNPAERTLQAARTASADLMILSTHGRSGLTDFPLSGTASKVLAGAPMSVMVVPSEQGPTISSDYPYRTILAPVDLTSHSYASAHLAAHIARGHDAELLLVAVVPTPEILTTSAAPRSLGIARQISQINRGNATRHLGELMKELEGSVRVRRLIVDDADVSRALEKVAEDESASLIVVGAHGRSGDPAHPHGVVATRLLERVARPLLVFQTGPITSVARPSGKAGLLVPILLA